MLRHASRLQESFPLQNWRQQRSLCQVSDIILASNNEDILLHLNLE